MSTDAGFDPAAGYRLSSSVSVRPEPFGALLYDFQSRRLSFLKTVRLVRVVRELERHVDVRGALTAAQVPGPEHERYLNALAGLAAAGTIVARGPG